MDRLGYGVIGLGRISSRHLDTIEQMEGAQLVAVADVAAEKAEAVAAARSSQPTAYQNYQDLLADKAVDVAVVCVPTQTHAEVTIAAAVENKHVFCEKAMAPTLKQCRDMIATTDDAGVKLMIGQSTRFNAPYVQARRVIESGQIGDIIAIDGAFTATATQTDDVPSDFWRFKAGAQGHGHVVNFGCHYIDTARYLCADDPKQVSAYISNRFSGGQTPEDQWVITSVCEGVEGGATDGRIIITIGTYSSPKRVSAPNAGFTVYGTEGLLLAYGHSGSLALVKGTDRAMEVSIDEDLLSNEATLRMHKAFRQCIEEDTTPPVTGHDGMFNVQWALAAYLSHQRRAWMDLPLGPEFYEYGGPRLYEEIAPAES
jgi:predicted dehydrogenase